MSKGLNEKSGRSLREDADKGAVPSANQRRWGFRNFSGIEQLRKEHVLVLSGIALVLIVGAIGSIRYEGWEEEQERQLMEIRAEALRLQLQAENLKAEQGGKNTRSQGSELPTLNKSPAEIPNKGTIGVYDPHQKNLQEASENGRREKAKQQYAYAQRVIADLNRLATFSNEIQAKLSLLQTRAGMLGAGGLHGWGEQMARKIGFYPATGCADQVKGALISDARMVDYLALKYMNLDYREIEQAVQDRMHELFWGGSLPVASAGGVMRECRRLANADLQYFGNLK